MASRHVQEVEVHDLTMSGKRGEVQLSVGQAGRVVQEHVTRLRPDLSQHLQGVVSVNAGTRHPLVHQ